MGEHLGDSATVAAAQAAAAAARASMVRLLWNSTYSCEHKYRALAHRRGCASRDNQSAPTPPPPLF